MTQQRRVYLKNLQLTNFKSFKDETITFSSAINYLVGNNNAGKTSIIDAIRYLCEEIDYNPELSMVGDREEGMVSGVFVVGEAERPDSDEQQDDEILEVAAERKLVPGARTMYYLRNAASKPSDSRGVETKAPNVGVVSFMASDNAAEFNGLQSNSKLKQLFDNSTLIPGTDGKRVNTLARLFSQNWDQCDLGAVAQQINQLIPISTGVELQFREESGRLSLMARNCNQVNLAQEQFVDISKHGNGLQRAVAFALLREFAQEQDAALDLKYADDGDSTTMYAEGTLFCIDEPENMMHPKGQQEFAEVLEGIAQTHQVFLSTHSPFVIQSHYASRKNGKILLVEASSSAKRVHEAQGISLVSMASGVKSLGEVIYEAYQIPTSDYHCELFGRLQTLLNLKKIDEVDKTIKKMIERRDDKASLLGNRFATKHGKRECYSKSGEGVLVGSIVEEALPTLTRNLIDHPEAADEYKEIKDRNSRGETFYLRDEFGEHDIDFAVLDKELTMKVGNALMDCSIDMLRTLIREQTVMMLREKLRILVSECRKNYGDDDAIRRVYEARNDINKEIYKFPPRYTYKAINLIVLFAVLGSEGALEGQDEFAYSTRLQRGICEVNKVVRKSIETNKLEESISTKDFRQYWKAWEYVLNPETPMNSSFGTRGKAIQAVRFMQHALDKSREMRESPLGVRVLRNYLDARMEAIEGTL